MATMKEVFNTLTAQQKHVVYVLIGKALKHKQPIKIDPFLEDCLGISDKKYYKEYIFMLDEDNNESEVNDGRN